MSLTDLLKQQQLFKSIYSKAVLDVYDRQQPIERAYKALFDETIINNITLLHKYNKAFTKIGGYPQLIASTKVDAFLKKALAVQYSFDQFLNAENNEAEITISESKRLQLIIKDIYKDNSLLLTLEPRNFEECIAELLFNQGFEVELTNQTRDNGFDILAVKYVDKHNPLKFLVECKRYKTKKVGVEVVRGFKEVIATEKANRGIIVTTSYFTTGAQKKQKEQPYLLDFRDKDKIIEWVKDYCLKKLL